MDTTVIELARDVTLTCVTTDKFKTGCLSATLLTQLSRETAAQNALIPSVLRRGTLHFPDMERLNVRLAELYGASIDPVVRKKGEIQCLGFFSRFADDAFVPGQVGVLDSVAALLCEALLSPNLRGGLFLPEIVQSEKEKQLDLLRSRMNDKRSYALERLIELMCFAEDYAVYHLGDEESTELISYQKLTHRYRTLLGEAPLLFFYCGSAQPEYLADILRNALLTLPRAERNLDLGTEIRLNAYEPTPRTFTEELDVTQGKLAIGFRLGEFMDHFDLAALKVFNAVYGGCTTSKLFENVREKLSLAYYASSMTDRHKGILAVSSGIEFDKLEAAKAEIFAQLDAVRQGDITPEELLHAKNELISGTLAMLDSPGALEDFYLAQYIDGLDFPPEDLAEQMRAVTRDEVVAVAQSVECDAIYFLRGEEESGDVE